MLARIGSQPTALAYADERTGPLRTRHQQCPALVFPLAMIVKVIIVQFLVLTDPAPPSPSSNHRHLAVTSDHQLPQRKGRPSSTGQSPTQATEHSDEGHLDAPERVDSTRSTARDRTALSVSSPVHHHDDQVLRPSPDQNRASHHQHRLQLHASDGSGKGHPETMAMSSHDPRSTPPPVRPARSATAATHGCRPSAQHPVS